MNTTLHVYINDRTDLPGVKVGEPYIVEEPTMRIVSEPSQFLLKHFVESGRRASKETWKAAAYALVGWLDYLEAKGLPDWTIAARMDLVSYRDALLGAVSPHTGLGYAKTTIGNRMRVVIAYYKFGATHGWYQGDLADIDESELEEPDTAPSRPIDKDALAHTRKGKLPGRGKKSELNDLLPKKGRRAGEGIIRPFGIDKEWRAFVAALGPLPSEIAAGQKGFCRDRLMCETAVWTGMRLAEVHSLRRHQFLVMNPDPEAPGALQPLTIIGKGDKQRTIGIPNFLVAEILLYLDGERLEAITAAGLTGRREPPDLFVGGTDSNRTGRPMSKRRYEQIVEEACFEAGLFRLVAKLDAETGEVIQVKDALHTFHDFRHTYAVWTYYAERRRGNAEPWKVIQAQLGHEHMSTTIDTYLHYVEIFGSGHQALDVRQVLGI